MSIDWRRKDSDRWIGRTHDGHLLLVQRASDRKRWSWKVVPPGGGTVLGAGIAVDEESAKKSAEAFMQEREATSARVAT